MTLPTGLVLRTFFQHVFMADRAILTGRRYPEGFKGTVALVTFYHAHPVPGVEPLFVQIRRGFSMTRIAGNVLFLGGKRRMFRLL